MMAPAPAGARREVLDEELQRRAGENLALADALLFGSHALRGEPRGAFARHRKSVGRGESEELCELRLQRRGGPLVCGAHCLDGGRHVGACPRGPRRTGVIRVAKYTERMADPTTNVAGEVIFMGRAEDVRHGHWPPTVSAIAARPIDEPFVEKAQG